MMAEPAVTSETETAVRTQCPRCDSKVKRVGPVTLRSLLKEDFAARIDGGEEPSACGASSGSDAGGCQPVKADTGWRFCDSPDCDVVYFSEHGDATFTKSQLRVEVGIKESSGERPLCYCFGHSVQSMKRELQASGNCTALEDIRAKMNDPGCHCETANPSGSCCLGSVAKGLKIARRELNMSDEDVSPPPDALDTESGGLTTSRGEKIATAGTLISAIMASSCCWLPLVLLAVGVSGAGIVSTLEAYRPLFIVVTFGFLGAAFYFTYRPKKTASVSSDDCCVPNLAASDDCCSPNFRRRFNMVTLNKVMLWVITVLAAAFLFFPNYVGKLVGTGDDHVVTSNMRRVVLKIEGMTCEGCAVTVAQAIRGVPGVHAVTVHYEKQEAIIGTNRGRPIPIGDILAALKDAGYRGELISQSTPGQKRTTRSDKKSTQETTDESQQPLRDLSNDAREFRDNFDAAIGKVRVVLLVSPG